MRWIITCFSIVAILAFFGASKEIHANPACGDTLFANTTFDDDLDCSGIADSTAALTIGADNIIVDLDGKTLIGPSKCVKSYPEFCRNIPAEANGTRGILVDGFDGVVIKNGQLTGFERGIRVINAHGIRIENLEAYGNAFSAVRVREDASVIVVRANFHDNFNDAMGASSIDADATENPVHLTVLDSKINHNHASGMFIFRANLDLRNNELKENVRSALNLWASGGTVMHNKIQDNNVIPSNGTDFGQISLVLSGSTGDVGGGLVGSGENHIVIRCNEIVDGFSVDEFGDSADALTDAIAPGGIGIRRNFTNGMGRVEITRNKFEETPVAIYVTGGEGELHVHRNTFKDNGIDVGYEDGSPSTTVVDAANNHWEDTGVASVDTSDTSGIVDALPTLEDSVDSCDDG